MTDAYGLYGAFSGKKGWTKERVDKMLNDLVSECLLPTGRWAENNHFQFYGAACTISLPEYERALVDIPKLKKKKPEAICVDYMVTVALSAIPEDLSQTTRKSGTAEIFFDNNEPFLRQIKAAWDRRHKRREDVLRLVSDVQPADSRSTYPLQAADFLAFTTRRSYASGDRKRAAFYNHLRQIATPTYDKFFDYDKLIERYGGNKS